jgi:hypothetical protein
MMLQKPDRCSREAASVLFVVYCLFLVPHTDCSRFRDESISVGILEQKTTRPSLSRSCFQRRAPLVPVPTNSRYSYSAVLFLPKNQRIGLCKRSWREPKKAPALVELWHVSRAFHRTGRAMSCARRTFLRSVIVVAIHTKPQDFLLRAYLERDQVRKYGSQEGASNKNKKRKGRCCFLVT